MRPVRFLRSADAGLSSYLTGEEAAFSDDMAAHLVKHGVAVYTDVAPTLEAAPKADSPTPPSSQTATGAASTSEAPPEPAKEAADIRADNVSRTTRAERRNRR